MGIEREESIKVAAELVRVHPDTLARWARAGRVVAYQHPAAPPRRRRHGGPRWRVALAPGARGGWRLVVPGANS